MLALWPALVSAQAPTDPVIAVIGQKQLRQSELDQSFASRGRNFGTSAEAQVHHRDMLVAEYWVDQTFGQAALRDPTVRNSIDEARRQILFELYAQSQFEAVPPDEAAIDAYIAARPALFADRVVYRFQQITVATSNVAEIAEARQVLAALTEGPVDEAALAAARTELTARGLTPAQNRFWVGGEALSAAVRDRLDAMARDSRPADLLVRPTGPDLLVLFETMAEPADPQTLRAAVAGRILQDRYRDHKRNLARSAAAPLLGTLANRVARPASPVQLGLLGGVGALVGLGLAALFQWVRRTQAYFRLARRNNIDALDMGALQRPLPVAVLALILAPAALAATGWILSHLPVPLASLEALSVLGGLALLGLVLGLLLWRGADETLERSDRRRRGTARAALLLALIPLALAGAFFVFPGEALSLITRLATL